MGNAGIIVDEGAVAAEAGDGVKERGGEEGGLGRDVEGPVPVGVCACVAAFLSQCLLVGGDEVSVPRKELSLSLF